MHAALRRRLDIANGGTAWCGSGARRGTPDRHRCTGRTYDNQFTTNVHHVGTCHTTSVTGEVPSTLE